MDNLVIICFALNAVLASCVCAGGWLVATKLRLGVARRYEEKLIQVLQQDPKTTRIRVDEDPQGNITLQHSDAAKAEGPEQELANWERVASAASRLKAAGFSVQDGNNLLTRPEQIGTPDVMEEFHRDHAGRFCTLVNSWVWLTFGGTLFALQLFQ